MGDEYYDALANLHSIYDRCEMDRNSYPEVDITEELGIRFFNAYYEIADYVSEYLCNHEMKQRDWDYRDQFELDNRYC